jgi:UDP-2,3-diacylglucosamine pyrophosphatase LpxH
MLIFVSDLHFVDGSAGEHNVPTDAFTIFFQDIAGLCKWHARKGRQIDTIKLIFLGDIFDLLRTEEWFKIQEEDRPWGKNEPEIGKNAAAIFDGILEENKATFDLLSGDLKADFGLPVEPIRVYVPGNHDRLCNKYGSLRKKVRGCLGISTDLDSRFEHYFLDVDHGVFARHGHEFDKFNYEGSISYTHEDYMRMPIGDPITTELIARFPYTVMANQQVASLPKDTQQTLKRNLQDIENVRPFSATIDWLLYQVKTNMALKRVIEDSIDQVVKVFNSLAFVQKWYDHHDRWTDWWDEADKIQAVLFLLEKFKVFPSEKLLPLVDKVKRSGKDEHLEAAANEYAHLDNRIRYVVYGHTHEPKQKALRVTRGPAGISEQVYLNTGTWRTRYHKCTKGLDFIGWKNLTHVIFYTAAERGGKAPSFETWTGTLKTL